MITTRAEELKKLLAADTTSSWAYEGLDIDFTTNTIANKMSNSEELTVTKAKELIKNSTDWVKRGTDYITLGLLDSSLTYWNNKTGQLLELRIRKDRRKNPDKALLSTPTQP